MAGAQSAGDALAPYLSYVEADRKRAVADLERYVDLLSKWQVAQNLVSRETLPDVWSRHIGDSLQVLPQLRPSDRAFIDLGSGGGLPAIPLAVALRDRSGYTATLVEPNQRKASFLRTAARELELPLTIAAFRIEDIDSRETRPDVITSRALARLPELCRMAAPFFGPDTQAIFHKGEEYAEEVADSRSHWEFDMLKVDSHTKMGSALLILRHLHAKPVS